MRLFAAVLMIAVALTGCSASDDESARLDAARERWEAAGIDDYTWSFTRQCFCPPLSAEVRVRDGRAVAESVEENDQSFPGIDAQFDFRTMDELFDFIERELLDSDELRVDYDAETGRVLRFDADQASNAVDDELGYRFERFAPAEQGRPGSSDVELTESYPCGFGLQGSNTDQTVGVTLELDPSGGQPAAVTTLPDPQWTVTLLRGEHLFANWCNDLVPPGTPERRVAESLPIVAGTIAIDGPVPAFDDYGAEVTATLTGLVAEQPDGTRIDVADAELVNTNWGGAAG